MRKYIPISLILFVTFLSSRYIYSQTIISPEQILGNWEVIAGEGEGFEEDILGYTFHFKESGIIVAGMPPEKAERTKTREKKGFWKIVENNLILFKEHEDMNKDEGTLLVIKSYEGNLLVIFDPKEDMTITFKKRINN